MDCAGRCDFANGMRTDDVICPQIAQGGQVLHMGCTGTPDFFCTDCTRMAHFVHTMSTDDRLRLHITQRRPILRIDCARKVVCAIWLRRKGWFRARIAHWGFCVCECSCVVLVLVIVVLVYFFDGYVWCCLNVARDECQCCQYGVVLILSSAQRFVGEDLRK